MAFYKFYNLQLLPIHKSVNYIGPEGYVKLFAFAQNFISEGIKSERSLSSTAVEMRGDMFFATFSVDIDSYSDDDGEKDIVYGYFLKFDDVNELVDTNSGDIEYVSKGNTSSRRYAFEFVFDPYTHVMAIHDVAGLPTRQPLIKALSRIFAGYANKVFKDHSVEVIELTSADSVIEFLKKPVKGYKRYEGEVTFSNSDDFEDEMDRELIAAAEQELNDKKVAKWGADYRSFPDSVMIDLPEQAKIQMRLATKHGNAEVTYLDVDGERQKFQMDDYPVRERLDERKIPSRRQRAFRVIPLIKSAISQTRRKKAVHRENEKYLDDKEE